MSRVIIVVLVLLAVVSFAIFAWGCIRFANKHSERKHEEKMTEKEQRHEQRMSREERDHEALIESIENDEL